MPPLVIGHAAAGGEAPENTLAGVRAAIAGGADAIEIDVQLSADGIPVLMHDLTLERTTSLRGRVANAIAADLRAADAGGGEFVPALDDVLDLVAGRITVMCELKVRRRDASGVLERDLVDAALRVIRRHAAERWSAVHSFDPEIVGYARASGRHVPAAVISPAVDLAGAARLFDAALDRNAQAVSVEHSAMSPALVRMGKQRQLTVFAWTADSEDDWARLVAAGVDGIMSDVPSRLRAFIGG